MKHLIIICLWRTLEEIVGFFDSRVVFGYHWIWKIYPRTHVQWCVKNYGSINSAKKAILWWRK